MRDRTEAGIAYEERGSGFPFVALHGFTLDRRMSIGAFEPLFDREGRVAIPASAGAGAPEGAASARAYRRIYPDLPLMGESTATATSSDRMLDALTGFIREAIPAGPFLLAGESYGGYLARGLASRLGDRVAGLFLLCPMIVARAKDRSLPEAAVLREEPRWREGASPEDAGEFEEVAVIRTRYAFERTRNEIIPGIRAARKVALAPLQARAYAFSFDRLGALRPDGSEAPGSEPFDPPFDRPACFVLGRQDSSVGWRDALRLAGRYPRGSFHILDAAGHNLQIEQAGAFGAAFGTWIGDCEA